MTGFGSLWLMVRRGLRQHWLSSAVAAVSVALAAGLALSVFSIREQAREAFVGGQLGFDAVLGARGSATQLVLNAVYHLETSPGNIPWAVYKAVEADPRVSFAIPYATGDNYRNFRIVGTTGDIFTKVTMGRDGRKIALQPGGRSFDETRREAVVGSFAAARTGLRVGSEFNAYHGLTHDEKQKHDEVFTVVGVMEPTNTPLDRVILIPIDGIFRMGGHVLRGTGKEFTPNPTEAIPDEHKEVSAVLLKLKSFTSGMSLSQMVNRQGKVATLAWPVAGVMADLFDKIGWFDRVLALVSYVVMGVATGAIFASLYNTISGRRREFAILRSIGARRRTILLAVMFEAAVIAALGAALGFVMYAGVLLAAAAIIQAQTGIVLTLAYAHWSLWVVPTATVAMGVLAGLVPALRAYRTDVAENLSPLS